MFLDLQPFRKRPPILADRLTWGNMLRKNVILQKDGSFLSVIRFRGHDLDTATEGELVAFRAIFNNAIRRLGSGWVVHMEVQRRRVPRAKASVFPDPITAAFDAERRHDFDEATPQYESVHTLAFTYLPPTERKGSALKLLFEGVEDSGSSDYEQILKNYMDEVSKTCDLFTAAVTSMDILEGSDLLSYLHSTVTDHPVKVAVPDVAIDLDVMLTNCRFVGGVEPQIGDKHIRTLGIRSWPNATTPAMLDGLNNLGMPYRWVARWMPYDRNEGLRKVGNYRKLWYGKRKSIQTLIGEALSKKESNKLETNALDNYDDANAAFESVQKDIFSVGHFTLTITTEGDTAEQAATRIRTIRQQVDSLGMVSVVETINAVDAWLGSLPGHPYADTRRPLIQSLNVVDLAPLTSVWAGEERCEHLDGPPLLTATARGSTPFRLNLWEGDVGHTMVLGATGGGKSTLLGTLAAQFRRYPGAQVYFFDFGRSSRALTMAVGGDFHDLGTSNIDFQPLRTIDEESELEWAAEYVVELVRLSGLDASLDQKEAIWDALQSVANVEKKQRTLSTLMTLVQNAEVKSALQPYTIVGSGGRYLDASRDTLEVSEWQAFELEELLKNKTIGTPVLLYVFHVLEKKFAARKEGNAPTLLILDEAWAILQNPLFASKLAEWLKTLRKRNVAVVFATQSLSDISRSKIAPTLIESCPTTIFLPNAKALDPDTAANYEAWGLSKAELRLLAEARPKREYYFRSRRGRRIFSLNLGEYALSLVGASDGADQILMNEAVSLGLRGKEFHDWFVEKRKAQAARRALGKATKWGDRKRRTRGRYGCRRVHPKTPSIGELIMKKKLAQIAFTATATVGMFMPTKAYALFGVGDVVSAPILEALQSVNNASFASSLVNDGLTLANQANQLLNEAEQIYNQVQRIEQEARNLLAADLGDWAAYINAWEGGRARYRETSHRLRWFQEDAEDWFDGAYRTFQELFNLSPEQSFEERQEFKTRLDEDNRAAQRDSLTVAKAAADEAAAQAEALNEISRISAEAQGALSAMQAQTAMTREVVHAIQRLEELHLAEMRRQTTESAGETQEDLAADAAAAHFYRDAREEFSSDPVTLPGLD